MAKILVADDSADALQLFTILLKTNKHEIKNLTAIKELKPLLQTFTPDLILIDEAIAQQDEYALCKMIAEQARHTPILLLTSNNISLQQFEPCNVYSILKKPVNMMELIQKTNAALIAHSLKK